MLGPKLKELEEAIAAGAAPRWAQDLDPAYLDVLKDLGNAAVYPSGGDVSKQDALNPVLLQNVKTTFVELLI